MHWTETADRTSDNDRVIGEDERGDLWVPSRQGTGWWDRPLSLWRPTHWPYWLRSRVRREVAFIETGAGSDGAH